MTSTRRWHGRRRIDRQAGRLPVDAVRTVQLFGISTVSMRYTVALRVWTLPHTTRASLAVYVSPDFAVRDRAALQRGQGAGVQLGRPYGAARRRGR